MRLTNYLNEGEDGIQVKIKKFFIKNPNPSDKMVHSFAESIGIDEHKFEEHIYTLLTSLLKSNEDKVSGGMADKKKPGDFDQKELAMGIKVEMEHTDDPDLAKEIAMDHLTEIPTYYSRLKKMEADAEKDMENEKK